MLRLFIPKNITNIYHHSGKQDGGGHHTELASESTYAFPCYLVFVATYAFLWDILPAIEIPLL